MTSRWTGLLVLTLMGGGTGCLDPMVDDQAGFSPHIQNSRYEVPNMMEDIALANRVDAHDGVDGLLVARNVGYAGGEPLHYWDFGEAPQYAIPVWLIRRCDEDGNVVGPVPNHPNIIDLVPGDVGYSPFWVMVVVCVTDQYEGQVLASFEAIEDAIEIGLAEPMKDTGMWANCPVVLPNVGLELGEGEEPYPPHAGYFAGMVAYYHHLGGMMNGVYGLDENGFVLQNDVFMARTASGQACEPVFQVDRSSERYSPLWRVVEVELAEGEACQRDMSSLVQVDGDSYRPASEAVVQVRTTEQLLNLPIQYAPGSP